jgi:hypothetical protein
MTTFRQSRMLRYTLPIVGLAVSCSLHAQSGSTAQAVAAERPVAASTSIDPVEATSQLNSLETRLSDRDSLQRVQTLQAIDASPAMSGETARRVLQNALEDKDPVVSEAALRALLNRGEEQLSLVRSVDLTRFSGETADLVRVHLAQHDQDVSALRDLMRNGDAVVQEAAFEALASSDAHAAIELLKDEFRDTDSLSRLQTLELFASSPYTNSPATLKPILEAASNDANPLIRDRAKELLEKK